MSNRRKRPQSPKSGKSVRIHAEGYAEGMRELRKGSRAQPHALATDYRRRPKHAARGWSEE